MTQSPTTDDKSTLPADWVSRRVLSQADVEQLRDLLAAGSGSACSPHAAAAGIASRMIAGLQSITTDIAKITSLLEPLVRIAKSPTGFVVIALVLSLPLIWNPGYFSHDELQWLAFADKPTLGEVPWSAWFDFSTFQYRPLTFNLWLLLSHWFGYQPMVMHLLRVLFGIAAAWLLRSVLLQFEVSPRRATIACWLWLLTPYTVYTHGWVGTFGDSLCLIFLLMALRHTFVQSRPDSWASSFGVALPVATLAALALMSKESAVVFPTAMLIAVFRRRDKTGVAAFALAAVVVLAYLALRLPTILFPAYATQGYAWHLANIPVDAAQYTLFPFLIGHFEVVAARTHLTNWAALLPLALLAAASFGAGWRRGALFWIGWILALGPVLILDDRYNQYAYLAGAWACAFFAWTWPTIRAPWRLLMVLPIATLLGHGIQQVLDIRHIGQIQHNLYADLPGILVKTPRAVTIQTQRRGDDFVLRRLLTDVPGYHRTPVTGRVSVIVFADKTDRPDYLMSGDGHLTPAR